MSSSIKRDGDVSVVTLDEGRGNALSFESVAAIGKLLDDVQHSGVKAAVLTGAGEKVFGAGLDLRACSRFDRATMVRYVDAFETLFERLLGFPVPLVAYVNGAAIAGGAVIALACDMRVMAPAASLALNEVELGLPFPSMALLAGKIGIPSSSHVDGIVLGKRFDAIDAVGRNVAHAVGDLDDAVARAREFTTRGVQAVSAVKLMLRAEALERARKDASQSRRNFVDAFFGADAQARIGAIVAKLEKR